MEFDKSKVYTALNADELKEGSKTIGADTLNELKFKVEHGIELDILVGIGPEDEQFRFHYNDNITGEPVMWSLAYLVEEPTSLKWTDLKVGDVIRAGSFDKMITVIDSNPETIYHIKADGWLPDSALKEYQKVN